MYYSENNDHTKYYNQRGEEVPSVTTVLKLLNKDGLIEWSNWMGLRGTPYKNYMNRRAYVGTCVHNVIEARLKKEKFVLEKELQWFLEVPPYIEQFDIFYKEHPFTPIDIEQVMVGDKFGGTCDCYCIYEGKRTILDFKTSKSVHMSMFLQLAAYTSLKESMGDKVEQVGILQVNPNKCSITLKSREDIEDYVKFFYKLADLFLEHFELQHIFL